jgi:hypothetical protein
MKVSTVTKKMNQNFEIKYMDAAEATVSFNGQTFWSVFPHFLGRRLRWS